MQSPFQVLIYGLTVPIQDGFFERSSSVTIGLLIQLGIDPLLCHEFVKLNDFRAESVFPKKFCFPAEELRLSYRESRPTQKTIHRINN